MLTLRAFLYLITLSSLAYFFSPTLRHPTEPQENTLGLQFDDESHCVLQMKNIFMINFIECGLMLV